MSRRGWIAAAAVALVVAVGTGVFLFGDGEAPARKSDPPKEVGSAPVFDFDLILWRCRHADAITSTQVVKADGEFCFAALDVTNTGGEPATLDPSCQYLLDREGARYSPDPEVMALDDFAVAGFGSEIGPGELVENSALYYDVPKWTHPASLELHEDCEDEGVIVRLSASTNAKRSDS